MDFSIIIPAKNEELNIRQCLQSIYKADANGLEFELLVIDNGSSDKTPAIAKELGAIVYILPSTTISGLRNFGAAKAQGKILAFIDADCSVAKDWLQQARRYLTIDGIVCFGSPPRIPISATWVQRAWSKVREKNYVTGEVGWLESMNMFVPRAIFASVGGFDESLITCEDYDLSLRLKKLGRIVSDSHIATIHHGEAATLIHFFKKERWRGTGNIQGALKHGFHWYELPSLIFPVIHILFLLTAIFLSVWLLTGGAFFVALLLIFLLIIWQLPISCLAFWKCRSNCVPLSFQLALLLNVFFFARGLALIRAVEFVLRRDR